jgi:hypothetical protein
MKLFHIDSLKINKKVFLTFLYDILYYGIIASGFVLLSSQIKKKVDNLTASIDYSALLSTNIDLINQNFALLKMILAWLFVWIFLFSIFALSVFSLFKGLIWLKLNNKQFSGKFFKKYLLVNIIYLVPVSIISIFVLLKLKSNFLLFLIILVSLHFHVLLSYFSIENKIKNSFKLAFKKGLKIKSFMGPYIIILAGLFLLSFILNKILPVYAFKVLVNFIIIIFYFSINRQYINNFLRKII